MQNKISTSLLQVLLVFACLFINFSGCSESGKDERPDHLLVLDKVGRLENISESLEKQLSLIRGLYQIEVVLAVVPSTDNQETVKEMAARLFTQWDIGRNYDGRGLLLLLIEDKKIVRLEVGSILEGVYTDAFTGYIEDKQLKSYYLSDQLDVGLIAVIEEIEARANLFANDDAFAEKISDLDLKFLSGGGGADVRLDEYQRTENVGAEGMYQAGENPELAWQTLIQSWRDKNRDPNIGIYTPVTRLAYRAYVNQPNKRFEDDVRTWGNKPYEIISNNDYAVVFFGNKKGWENAPFLFSRTNEGWQFDIVHQRKIVRMGRAPHWGIERGEHPYINLLSRCPYWMGQDIPWPAENIYDVKQDKFTAERILSLEQQLAKNKNDFDVLLELGKLYTTTSMGQQRITLLNRANKIQNNHPEVLKNLAIAHVDAHYQYKTALKLMDEYVKLLPQDSFGHFYRGYLQLMENQFDAAVISLENGLELDPDNIYGLGKLARAYLKRNKKGDKQHVDEIINRLEKIAPDHIRLKWLRSYVNKQ